MKKLLTSLALIAMLGNLFAQSLSSDRLANWEQAGIQNQFENKDSKINFLEEGGSFENESLNDSIFLAILKKYDGRSISLFFDEGAYSFGNKWTLPSGITISGTSAEKTKLIFDLGGKDHLITIQGQGSSKEINLELEVKKGDNSIHVSSADQLKVGDWVYLIDNDSLKVTSSWAKRSTGQYLEIVSIAGSNVVFGNEIRRDYKLSDLPKIIVVEPVRNVLLSNLEINRLDETQSQRSNLYFNYATNCKVHCIKSIKTNFAHVDIRNSSHIEIKGSYFTDAFNFGGGGKAYGVMLHFGTGDCLIEDNIFKQLRHSMILQAGANGNVFAYNYSTKPYWTGVGLPSNSAGDMVLHGNYPYTNLFEGNIAQNLVIDNSHGINGRFNTFFRNKLELYGIVMNSNPSTNEQNFIENEVSGTGLFMGNYVLAGNDHFELSNKVKGKTVPNGSNPLERNSFYLGHNNNNESEFVVKENKSYSLNKKSFNRHEEGHFTACQDEVLAINNLSDNYNNSMIYPNPSTDVLTVFLGDDFNSGYVLAVYNTEGKMLIQKNMQSSIQELEIRNLQAGSYHINCKSTNKSQNFKLIKTN